MDNKVSRKIKLLIVGVLVLFLVASALEIVQVGGKAISRGFKAGYNDDHDGGTSHEWVDVMIYQPDAAVQQFPGGIELTPITVSGEIAMPDEMNRKPVGMRIVVELLFMVSLLTSGAFTVSLIVFAFKFPRRPILSHRNVISLRWIAYTLGTFSLTTYGVELADWLWMRDNIMPEGLSVILDSPPTTIIVALIILAMTEIMNLAGKLQHEQELTI